MELKKYYGKRVKITYDEGKVFEGIVTDYIFPEDNFNEKESIMVDSPFEGMVEFQSIDIRSITVI